MNNLEQNSLANKLLSLLRDWINNIIPQETRDCIRSKVAVIVKKNDDNTYNIILSEDYGDYLTLQTKKNNKELTDQEFKMKHMQ